MLSLVLFNFGYLYYRLTLKFNFKF